MLAYLDRFLNRVTMYRLTLYVLLAYVAFAGLLSLFPGLMPFTFWQLFFSAVFFAAAAWTINKMFSLALGIPVNAESAYITGLILALIVTPAADLPGYELLFWITLIAIASKFTIAPFRKHIFNPAALGVAASSFIFLEGASWWVGNIWLLVPAAVGGFVILRKIKRMEMVLWFLAANMIATLGYAFYQGTDVVLVARAIFLYSPLVFFGTIMFTEPATTPPARKLRILYALIVGVLSSPFMHFGNLYFTPELALVAGNIFSFLVSSNSRYGLAFLEKKQLGRDVYEFVFKPDRSVNFKPGQYLEWTLGHKKSDLRGNRRYFTIASSPTEPDIRLGVKFHPEASSFKKAMLNLSTGAKLFAGQLSGDFTLPADPDQKLVFIAGGIGITPYRSMLKYLLDKNEKRPITLFFSNKSADEIIYRDLLDEAANKLGIKVVYTLTQESPGWAGERGRISQEMIAKHAPDFSHALYYISGTHEMVSNMEKLIRSMGVPGKRIRTDFFPGFAQ